MRRRLRGGLVGCGTIAEHGHLPAYLERARSRGGLRESWRSPNLSEERRERARSLLPGVIAYEDRRQLLAGSRSDLDFIDLAAPPYCHAEIARAALAAGLHVLCEMPLATSPAEARAMLEDAAQAKRVLFPCHDYKHAPVVKAVRAMLLASAIGKVHLVTLQTFRTTHAKGARGWRPDWRRERQYSGGGIGMDQGSPAFGLAFEWLGSHPTAISAKTARLGSYDTEDNLSSTLTFPTGLAMAQLTWSAGAHRARYTLHGERGAISVDDDTVELVLPGGAGRGRPGRAPCDRAAQGGVAVGRSETRAMVRRAAQSVSRGHRTRRLRGCGDARCGPVCRGHRSGL